MRVLKLPALILALAVMFSVGWFWMGHRPGPREAQQALDEHRFKDAEAIARSWLERHPQDCDALFIASAALQELGSPAEAIKLLRQVPHTSEEQAALAQIKIAQIFLKSGRLLDAELTLSRIVATPSAAVTIDQTWIELLVLAGRRWESLPYLRKALAADPQGFYNLVLLAVPDEMPPPPKEMLAVLLSSHDPLAELGCGHFYADNEQPERAREHVRYCLARRPALIEALALTGQLLLKASELDRFDQWVRTLPQQAYEHPGIWFVIALRGDNAGNRAAAIRSYWEVLKRQPNHDRATYQLGLLLGAEGRPEDARICLERAERLTRLVKRAKMLEHGVRLSGGFDRYPDSARDLAECAQLTFELGRLRECSAWCGHLRSLAPSDPQLIELDAQLPADAATGLPWLLPESDLAARIDLSTFPLPDNHMLPGKAPGADQATGLTAVPQAGESSQGQSSKLTLIDDAARLGMNFVFIDSKDPVTGGKRMFETTGGGVAAFDFDHDGWCDLYFTQGTDWPPDSTNDRHLDALYRNSGGAGMIDVADAANIHDVGFGQGVSAGDFDNDGFPDLYVANINGNRLYRNLGDGTFADVTESSGLKQAAYWTTSCLIADLNADALPDLYDVTYLEGDAAFSRLCNNSRGQSRSCNPSMFDAAPDHVWMNRGDGSFIEVTHEWGFEASGGDGLGIVAADFDDSGSISLFIGNDGRANHFFAPEATRSGETHWTEMGIVSGLAFSDFGGARASMGIGAGDVNNDGRLDLFVTNLYHESSTLYLNLEPRSFSDRARFTGLREPSWEMVGFGTQFIDADRDSWEDLIVVNGHVDDFTLDGIPYRMRPQFYQNREGRFAERIAADLGPFFDEPKLGRGLARLDWNRDGLSDVVISHIGDPAALLTNQTKHPGHGIGLRLVGISGSRDAIGAKVTLTVGKLQLVRQLTAGDGYQATNERRLDFGSGSVGGDVELKIQWRGGLVQTFSHVVADREYLAIEGRSELIPLNIQ